MDDDDRGYNYLDPAVVAARDEVGKAVTAYLKIIRPEENPYVVAWAVGAEWTNSELELSGQAARDIISPSEQSVSATAGLGAYLLHRMAG